MSDFSTTVTPEILRSKANALDDVTGRYMSSVTTLYNLVEQMTRMWEGGAAQAFQTKFNGQKPEFEKAARSLRDFTQALRDSIDAYVRTDNEASNIINR